MSEEYNILKDQLFNERETYNFIDKLGYDDWNKKQVIREYIEHIRNENQRLQKKLDKAIELLISSEYKQFLINEKNKETIKECWLRYIEQELDK